MAAPLLLVVLAAGCGSSSSSATSSAPGPSAEAQSAYMDQLNNQLSGEFSAAFGDRTKSDIVNIGVTICNDLTNGTMFYPATFQLSTYSFGATLEAAADNLCPQNINAANNYP